MLKKCILLLLFIGLIGCSKVDSAEDRMEEFVKEWNGQHFEQMYQSLSKDAKKEISKKDFVNRYKTVYEQAGVKNLKVTAGKQDEEDTKNKDMQHIPYKVSMETKAGKVAFENTAVLKKEKTDDGESWNIDWDPSFIFKQLADEKTVQIASEEPKRGQIYDKNGKGLAINTEVPEIGIIPGQLGDKKAKVLKKLSEKLEISEDDIEKKLSQNWVKDDSYVPLQKIRPDEKDLISELTSLDGVTKTSVRSRYYPYGEKTAHLTGYIKAITAEELKKKKDGEYSDTSKIGIAGLENVYEDKLRGTTGWKIYVPETGDVIAEKKAKNGEDLNLTIDMKTQTKLYDDLKDDSGAAVALQPQTGETLALVSAPSYDPNGFIFGWNDKEWKKLNSNKHLPFSAKFKKTYAPGSTIKPIAAAIGLKSGTLDAAEKKKITGKEWQKDSSWGGYSVTRVSERLDEVNLENALITSDNIYFAQNALDMGADTFTKGLKTFGFAEDIPYEFPIETSSIANDKLDSDILLADSGYGQGQMQMSPLHLAAAYTPFVADGNLVKPSLVKKDSKTADIWHKQVVSKAGAEEITKGLKGVVEDERGSAYQPIVKGITVAGKTGTAELKKSKDEDGAENGWFVGYDYKNKDLLVAMMIEDVKKRGGSHYVVEKAKNQFQSK
ncbi:penicillin-binding transpeptidase domain-containing protein [Bacillus atrophaeus]|uniref:penicillin-binding transpeptidase domain-containing protein n=1 Tax=Bacillus atrophaeus TaxID=1452 RepID=UPI00227FA804|nr:penicillin-binding transpeptidase domain-containing protein [Bacillus atrophaeus]MCY8464099.1 penicillin-binding transpeptidase domain-containing protein [Bacillus atrophaeus]MCY8479338.1 penicillin-binding transpeptidase domain-containing protein [Bacillus atrophaeus]MCY8486452.1 penicillin-binding transpeptidase domain-containing protein [Bacillus atrophaeus]MCY8918635.1 penicillin-binding transpeptidase domain-containing protein [Bacillus atrophaeus]MCY8926678.1 penicillin-binding transp